MPEELKHVLFTLVESTILFLRLMCVQIYDCASLARACNMTISVEHEELGYQQKLFIPSASVVSLKEHDLRKAYL